MASNSNQQSNIASLKKSRLGESTQSNLIAGLSTKNTLSPNPSPLKSINSHNGLVGNTNNVTRNIDVLTEETIDSPSQFVVKRQDRGSRNITNLQLTPALAGSNNKIRLTEPNSPSALSRQLVNHIVQTSALSTLAANMNISKEDKLQYALSREDRELAKLQRIFEVERSKAEERQRKYQNSIDKTERGQDLHKQFISQRESNLKQKNDQAMARAKQNDLNSLGLELSKCVCVDTF